MPKKGGATPETKSAFLSKVLAKHPNLDYRRVNDRWAKAGHAGEISSALYYKVRRDLGIRTGWGRVVGDEAPRKSTTAEAGGEVYEFKITLLGIKPPIWRRIQVSDGALDELHEQIQTAMGWTNSHLHQFKIAGQAYGDPMLLQEMDEDLGCRDSTTVLLSKVLSGQKRGFRFEYEYDFGDEWVHEVRFEGRGPAETGKQYPLCLDGARACPPEDVGGTWGYVDFLEAMADRKHEQHNDMREWFGGRFDPEAFRAEVATGRMKAGLPDWRSMR